MTKNINISLIEDKRPRHKDILVRRLNRPRHKDILVRRLNKPRQEDI